MPMPAKLGALDCFGPEQPDLETKDWTEVLWSPSHFATSCGGGRTRYCRSILGSRKPSCNFSTWFAVPYIPALKGEVLQDQG